MKILWVIESLGSGGAQRQLVNLAKMQKNNNNDVSVICYHYSDFFAETLEKENIDVIWKIENNYLKRMFVFRRFIRKGNYDVVISFSDTANFLCCFAAIGGKKWKLITNELSAKQSSFTSKKGNIFAWFYRYSNVHVCNSENAKSMWLKHYPQYKSKLDVIYNPIVLPKITSTYTPHKNEKLHIVIAASYRFLKNPIGLIEALILLDENYRSQLSIDWYGAVNTTEGKIRPYDRAMKLIQTNNLQEVISLNDEIIDIANKMNEADIIALFSKVEGLPNAICEGMAIGKPIIMSKVSDFNILVDASNGFLCDWDSPDSIKGALISGISLSKKQLHQMGASSKDKAEKLFSAEIISYQWSKLISEFK